MDFPILVGWTKDRKKIVLNQTEIITENKSFLKTLLKILTRNIIPKRDVEKKGS